MSLSRVGPFVLAAVVVGVLLVPASSASATSSVLCSGYSSCTSKGYSNAGYSSNQSKSYWQMYAGTNCTNYVAYRLQTTNGMSNTRPKPGVGNANVWGTTMASITNSTPALGSVAWWGPSPGHHVAYVEKVISPTEILVSESNWTGPFDWRRIVKTGGGWPNGFIHFADLSITKTADPVVTGTARVGSTLTVSPGSWSPAPGSYTYSWLDNGVAIVGATANTLTLTPAQEGHKISATVTALRTSYASVKAATKTVTVAPGVLTASVAPAISGTPQVDQPLTASAGTWSATGVSYAYQWNVDGQAIPDATSATYVPDASDVDRHLTVTVTATKVGYSTSTSTSTDTDAVIRGVFQTSAPPTITGTAKVGSKLTIASGTWTHSPVLTYSWLADGTVIAGAVDRTFTPTASQVGKRITGRVSATRAGFTTKGVSSAATDAVAKGTISTASSPHISGSARYGSWLSRTGGDPTTSGTVVKRQWYRDGTAVHGATNDRYKITGADLAHKITVRLSYSASGRVSRSSTSPAVGPAQRATTVSAKASSKGGTVTFTITIAAAGGAKAGGYAVVSLGSASTKVKVSRGHASAHLTHQKAGTHTYTLRYLGTPTVASSRGSSRVNVR